MVTPSTGGLQSAAPDGARVVGLGASAGGLQPLEQFLAKVPADSGLAYIVVQHMDPTHKAMLRELLQRVTAMPVLDAAESMRIVADTVYVIPPNSELTVTGGVLHLADPVQPRGRRLPIDVLFGSLARDQGERAVGVVLSGMGSDGTTGLQAIKTQGGLTLAQQPETAQFDSMPRHAIAAGCVDIVAPTGELPERILSVVSGSSAASPGKLEARGSPLGSILGLLQERTKHDLSLYKPSTLLRRIERRVAVNGLPTMAAYEAFLARNPMELDLLFKEMLIGVTAFFRDPSVWQEIKDTVLPDLLGQRTATDGCLRVWVIGCSTGEEAYSLAMVCKEVTESSPEHAALRLQIFATDLSMEAIAIARRGCYPAKIVSDVTPERLARFFSAHGEGYRIDKSVREMVLFAQHDVILDPPFTRLDILSCRNLLIYFTPQLQQRLVPLFHYSLRPGGVLLLGEAETVGSAERMFSPLHVKSRLYCRSRNHWRQPLLHFPTRSSLPSVASQESNMSRSSTSPLNVQSLAEQVLLQVFSPPAVLVNALGDILYISGRIGRYFEPAVGKANWNIHVMARTGIRVQLAVALRTALQEKQPVELYSLKVEDDGPEASAVDITVQAIHEPKQLEGMVMVVFRDVPAPRAGRRKAGRTSAATSSDELLRAQEEIRALRQEMRASQDELRAANEELESINEELQSANEELTTSKEEAQSMNEELQTINAELQTKLDDLALVQSDMQNLLNSTNIATLFLDKDLRVRRYTEQITRIIPLRNCDIGRPMSDLASTLLYSELPADANETLRTLAVCEKEIRTTDEHWFSVRIMPYRTVTDVVGGVVITFVDISTAKELEARLRKA